MRTRNKQILSFIDKIRNEAAKNGVKVSFTKSKTIYAKDGSPVCCGIFIPPTSAGFGHIRVATGGQTLAECLLSLAHEFIHMRQFVNKEKIYFSSDLFKLEKNTELRAISFMKKNKLPRRILIEASKHSVRYIREVKLGLETYS